MTKEQLERTRWARKFKKDNPSTYNKAIYYALYPTFKVNILSTETSNSEWILESIIDNRNTHFWMHICNTLEEATKLCILMNWNISTIKSRVFKNNF